MHMVDWVIWGFVELLLLRAISNPLRMVFDRRRFYQEGEFNGAAIDSLAILVAMILVGLLVVMETG